MTPDMYLKWLSRRQIKGAALLWYPIADEICRKTSTVKGMHTVGK